MSAMETLEAIKTELLASTITAVVIFAGRFLRREYRHRSIKRRYPIAGDYITYYDDEVDGVIGPRKATMVVTQQGYEFTAATRNLDERREWNLRGKILANGYLSGTYGRLDPNDPSKGSFFLEPDVAQPGHYQGHWSGYDSINRKITSGKYMWRKTTPVRVRELGPRDGDRVHEIGAIFADALGDRFITREKIADILTKNTGKFLLGAFRNKELLAVRSAYVLNEEDVGVFETNARQAGGLVGLKNYKVGILASNAVRKEHRRQGIGSQLVAEGLALLKRKGCTMCVATSWESESAESSANILEAFGFEHISTAEEHWKQDSLNQQYDCPKCGSPPCLCSARFYRRRL